MTIRYCATSTQLLWSVAGAVDNLLHPPPLKNVTGADFLRFENRKPFKEASVAIPGESGILSWIKRQLQARVFFH